MNFSFIGSAENGTDYTAVSSLLSFPAITSTVDNVMQCINVGITDDLVFEGPETFTVTVTTISSLMTLGNNDTTVTITDNEGEYSYIYSALSYMIANQRMMMSIQKVHRHSCVII